MKRAILIAVVFTLVVILDIRKTAFSREFLFAQIEKVNGKYYITKISNYEPLVFRINDLTPTIDTRTYTCYFQYNKPYNISPKGDLSLCKENEHIFRKLRFDVINIPANVQLMGIPLLLGLHTKLSVFDKEEFNKAVKEAFENTQIVREDLLNTYKSFNSEIRKMYNEYLEYPKNYIKFNHVVRDESGFYKKELDLSSFYKIEFLPFDFKVSFNPLEKNYKEFFNEKIDEIKSKITNSYYYKLNYKKEMYVYNYTISVIPEKDKIPFLQGQGQSVNIYFTILSKDFERIYPDYTHEDFNIRLVFKNNLLDIINKTPYFIQIKSIAMYCNGQIKNLTYESGNIIELPPNSKLKDPINVIVFESPDIIKACSFKNMTLRQAQNLKIQFGFAVKYRVVEQNIDRTLYKEIQYNLAEVLQRR